MKEPQEEIKLRTEEVQEIMGRVPSWIEKWGITFISLILFIILAGASVFPYPETLYGQFVYMPNVNGGNAYTGHAQFSAKGIGMIQEGAEVIVRLENYPENKFGYLEGRVMDVSKVANDDGVYLIDIQLPNFPKTSNGKKIACDRQAMGTAEIIVEKKRLIDRIGSWKNLR